MLPVHFLQLAVDLLDGLGVPEMLIDDLGPLEDLTSL